MCEEQYYRYLLYSSFPFTFSPVKFFTKSFDNVLEIVWVHPVKGFYLLVDKNFWTSRLFDVSGDCDGFIIKQVEGM